MRFSIALLLAVATAAAAGCDTGTDFRIDPLLATDTLELAVPNASAELASALDITASLGVIRGGRFPERQEDAEEFDFVLRRRDAELTLVPAAALGLPSRAGITQPLEGETFESLVEAPGRTAFVSDSAVVVRQGAVYAARSRVIASGFGSCQQYAKLQPLAVDAAAGTVRLQITTNERCADPRLALEG